MRIMEENRNEGEQHYRFKWVKKFSEIIKDFNIIEIFKI